MKVWSDDIALFIGTAQVAGNKYLRAEAGAKAMAGYFRALVEARTAAPTDDMISQLVLARDDRDALTTDEIIGTCILLLFAGHETTTNLIGNGFFYSMRHREQWERLVAEPGAGRQRGRGICCATTARPARWQRVAAADIEMGGKTIREGQRVFAFMNSANRDPEAFDDPERFDIGRAATRTSPSAMASTSAWARRSPASNRASPPCAWPSACRTSASAAASPSGTIR